MRQKCSRQHDSKCSLKSSQYTLINPNRVIQLTTISFWVPETRLRLRQVKKKEEKEEEKRRGKFPPKRVMYRHGHPFLFLFLLHPQESSRCSQPIRGNVCRTGRIFPEHVERSFLDPNTASSQFDEYPELGSRSKSSSN